MLGRVALSPMSPCKALTGSKKWRAADAVKGADELARDIRALPDPGENQFLAVIQDFKDCGGYLSEVLSEMGAGLAKGFRFDVDAASAFGDYKWVFIVGEWRSAI